MGMGHLPIKEDTPGERDITCADPSKLMELGWRLRPMRVPNWQHHSKKEQKRHLKPQALRQAKKRRGQLIKCLLDRPSRRFRCYYRYIR